MSQIYWIFSCRSAFWTLLVNEKLLSMIFVALLSFSTVRFVFFHIFHSPIWALGIPFSLHWALICSFISFCEDTCFLLCLSDAFLWGIYTFLRVCLCTIDEIRLCFSVSPTLLNCFVFNCSVARYPFWSGCSATQAPPVLSLRMLHPFL